MATASIDLFKGVGDEGGITVDAVKEFINANKTNDLVFNIDTMGGNLSNAITIHNLIKLHPKKTTARLVGMVASAGTVISSACDEVEMYNNVLFLIHNGMMAARGNKFELQTVVSDLDKNDKLMENLYAERTGQSTAVIAELMKKGDWMDATEAKGYGFVDKIIKSSMKIAASAVLNNARISQINNTLITKLESKMNLFKKNAVKAEALADGEYTLEDGTKIVVKGGVAEVIPAEPEMKEEPKKEEVPAAAAPAVPVAEMVAAVSEVVTEAINAVEVKFNAKIEALTKATGTHQPAKGTVKSEVKKVNSIDAAQEQVKELVAGIRKGIVESRKA